MSEEAYLGKALRGIQPDLVLAGRPAVVEILADPRDMENGGGASHKYLIHRGDKNSAHGPVVAGIDFQHGPIVEHGVNGIMDDDLLAILIDRLEGFQAGPFACRENAIILTHLQEAKMWSERRTAQRIMRGVEGKSKV